MERNEKLALLNRQLGLRHKLKVHDSVPPPDAHDDQAKHWVARWEMEDEVNAIEEILRDARLENVANLRASIEKNGPKKKKKI